VLAGDDRHALQPVASGERSRFETRIPVGRRTTWVPARANDAAGAVLATSPAARVL
jgi:hypothetical protein